ncbi:MAG TPA: TolC family protein [Opitutaceae bacterium]|nr:TolC family protein [Opitutaceae bacterium]
MSFRLSSPPRRVRALALGFALVALAARAADDSVLPQPLTLEAALAYGAAHNPTLLRVREQIREQAGVFIETNARRLPSLTASGEYARQDRELLALPSYDNDSWTIQVTASQVLYAGGGIRAGTRAAREQVEAARLAYEAQLNDTLLAIRENFAAVLLDRELIGVHEEAIAVLENELANARARREAGTGSEFEVIRAHVAVANAKPGLIQARNTYRIAQDRLRQMLGAPAASGGDPTELGVEGSLVDRGTTPSLGSALDAANSRRPELLRQKHLVVAAERGITVARAGYQPTVSAYAGYAWTASPLSARYSDRLDGWTAGVKSDWAVFDGRATAGKVRQARSRAEQARLATQELGLAIDVEVRQAHSTLLEAVELLEASEKTVEQAAESLRLARARQQAGTATQLDVLAAQSALTEARATRSQARYGHVVAFAALRRAIGESN